MAYATASTPRNRLPVLVTVGVIHVAAIYALVSGLAVNIFPAGVPIFEAKNTPLDPPKPPPPKPKDVESSILRPLTAPQSPLDLNRPTEIVVIDPILLPTFKPASNDGDIPLPIPTPMITPSFTPKTAAPRGNPGNWVTRNDYPASELRLEHQGITRFRITVGSDGRVAGCSITLSSGWPVLDAMACAKLTARARFDPATDENGAKTGGTYASAVKWEIPD